jgi:Zn-dependent protease
LNYPGGLSNKGEANEDLHWMTNNVQDGRWLSTPSERRGGCKPASERAHGKLRLGRILGIEIRLDTFWFIVFILITWSLAGHPFPTTHPGWTTWTYSEMGVVTALLLFASVVIHRLAHGFVSQATGVPVRPITLSILGGAAHISEEPRRARDGFLMAWAGPFTSLAIAAFFDLLWLVSLIARGPLHALAGWLAWINVSLAVFNLIPGFPLDGGRVLRAIIGSVTGNMRRATRIAAVLGRLVACGSISWGTGRSLVAIGPMGCGSPPLGGSCRVRPRPVIKSLSLLNCWRFTPLAT